MFEKDENLSEGNDTVKNENQVKNVYFDSMFIGDERCERDIDRRVTARNCTNGALHAFMNSQIVPKEM